MSFVFILFVVPVFDFFFMCFGDDGYSYDRGGYFKVNVQNEKE